MYFILKNTFKGCGKLIISAFVSGAKIIKYFPIHFATSLQNEIMQNMIFDSVFEVDSVLENKSDF